MCHSTKCCRQRITPAQQHNTNLINRKIFHTRYYNTVSNIFIKCLEVIGAAITAVSLIQYTMNVMMPPQYVCVCMCECETCYSFFSFNFNSWIWDYSQIKMENHHYSLVGCIYAIGESYRISTIKLFKIILLLLFIFQLYIGRPMFDMGGTCFLPNK